MFKFRTFYDRVDSHVTVYKEVNDAMSLEDYEDVVQPNCTLSIREIFDRWRRNLPIDLMTRNGTFMTKDGKDEKEDYYNAVDVDSLDPAEVMEYAERLQSKLSELSKTLQSKERERSVSTDASAESSNSDNGDADKGVVGDSESA